LIEPQRAPPHLPVVTGLASDAVPVQFVSELSHLDPNAEGWDTEAFSTLALAQLKELGHLLTDSVALDAAALGPYLADDFECSRLRPDAFETVFESQQFRAVRAANVTADSQSHATHAGAKGFAAALAGLLAPFSGWHRISAHFKLVGVEKHEGLWTTTAYVDLTIRLDDRSIQQNSTWKCQWIESAAGAPPLLSRLQIEDLEEVVFGGATATLYIENTGGVLGATESYRRQLIPNLEHWRDSIDWRFGLDVISPFGLAVGDANGDGLDDVLICEPGGLPKRLYLQNADGTAIDASAAAGIDFLEPTEAALFLDLDNDGDQDLVMASGRNVLVLENEGAARFQLRVVQQAGGLTRSLCAADYNGDRRLDVYVCCYIPIGQAAVDVGIALPMPMHDANNGAPNLLLQNMGDWRFEDVTAKVGLDQNNRRFTWAAAWEDFDNDGDLDLYVANDFGRNNLYRNDGGRFLDVAGRAGVEDQASGMSVSWGDYNHDGLMDLYVGNMFSSAGNRIAFQERFRQAPGGLEGGAAVDRFRRFARGNSLFANVGDGTFRDVTYEADVAMGRWAWGSLFVDINNDSWQDLVVGNGFITGQPTLDDL
jgi:hypothetical protein